MNRATVKPHLSIPKPIDLDADDSLIANLLATLTINWGRIEHQLFLILLFVDEKQAAVTTKKFFEHEAFSTRERVLRSQIAGTMRKDFPDFVIELDAQLEAFKSIRLRQPTGARLMEANWP